MVSFSRKNDQGSVLAVFLLIIAMMLILVLTLEKIMVTQQRSVNNYADYEVAQNYARLALLDAELKVLNFDVANNLELSSIASRTAVRSSITVDSACNNQGWCYSSNSSWTPWTRISTTNNKPCSSYSVESGNIPWIDEPANLTGHVQSYTTSNNDLCADPHYMLEFINPNFVGRSVLQANNRLGQEIGFITQINGARFQMYKNGAGSEPSARLYRITVRAFGKNGNTRVTLQEYVAITRRNGVVASTSDIIPISIRWLK